MPSSYLIPYCTTEEGKTLFLVGQKQVISYEAVGKLIINKWNMVKALIIKRENPIDKNERIPMIGKRFDGTLLPAGGKPAFLGGGFDAKKQDNTLQDTAIREFKEEFGLMNLNITSKNLEQVHNTEWGGTYYCLNLNNHPELLKILNIDKASEWIEKFEKQAKIDAIYNYRAQSFLGKPFPEMHKLTWVDSDSLKNYLLQLDEQYIKSQLEIFCEFIFGILKIGNDINLKKTFVEHLATYMKEQPIGDNVTAAEKVIKKMLGEQKVPLNSKMEIEPLVEETSTSEHITLH